LSPHPNRSKNRYFFSLAGLSFTRSDCSASGCFQHSPFELISPLIPVFLPRGRTRFRIFASFGFIALPVVFSSTRRTGVFSPTFGAVHGFRKSAPTIVPLFGGFFPKAVSFHQFLPMKVSSSLLLVDILRALREPLQAQCLSLPFFLHDSYRVACLQVIPIFLWLGFTNRFPKASVFSRFPSSFLASSLMIIIPWRVR